MTPEERKLYNERYYAEHKKDITEKLLIKIECPNCGKCISKANLERHKVGRSCKKHISIQQSQIQELQQQVEKLTKLLNEKDTD
jgi:acetyl-CoA carboxylase beta subunit